LSSEHAKIVTHNLRQDQTVHLIIFVFFLTVASFILRFYGLGNQSLWMDEVASLQNARAFGENGLAGLAASDHIAPLHSIILWLVTIGSEASETRLRLPSLVFGVMTVPVLAWIVFDMFRSAKFTAIATALICVSPYAIWHSQEARMYAPYLFFSVVLVALSWRAARGPFGIALWMAIVCFATLGL
jgi:uncharacterized membrane protein